MNFKGFFTGNSLETRFWIYVGRLEEHVRQACLINETCSRAQETLITALSCIK